MKKNLLIFFFNICYYTVLQYCIRYELVGYDIYIAIVVSVIIVVLGILLGLLLAWAVTLPKKLYLREIQKGHKIVSCIGAITLTLFSANIYYERRAYQTSAIQNDCKDENQTMFDNIPNDNRISALATNLSYEYLVRDCQMSFEKYPCIEGLQVLPLDTLIDSIRYTTKIKYKYTIPDRGKYYYMSHLCCDTICLDAIERFSLDQVTETFQSH